MHRGLRHNPISWFYDFDGDFYYGNTVESCFAPSGGHWFDITFGADCDDNNASIQVEALWYLDADGDGYYISSLLSCNSPGNGYVSSGVIAAGDCDDGNTAVSPVATELCGNSIDDNCNGQIDEDCCDVLLGLITSGISSNSAQLNWNTVTAANKYKIHYKKDAPGESWLPANVSAPATSYILTGLSSSTKYKFIHKF